MSANDEIRDRLTRHQVFMLRYAKGREAEAGRFIERMLGEVLARLAQPSTLVSRARVDALLLDLAQTVRASTTVYSQSLMDELIEFAESEVAFNANVLEDSILQDIKLPAPNQIQAAMFTNVLDFEPVRGYPIRKLLEEFGNKKAEQIIQTVRDGVVLGDTRVEISTKIMSNAEMQKSQARAIARTATNHISTQARQITMRENADLIDGYEWVATLDSRTSIICASRDGIVYEDIDSNPKPPAHMNCRSTTTFVVKQEYDLGKDIDAKRPAKGPDGAERVSEETSYQDWLKKQPANFQDEVLGSTRGKLFRQGGLDIGRFVDNSGKVLSLDQLRALDPLVFERAGL